MSDPSSGSGAAADGGGTGGCTTDDDRVQVWLVERAYSDEEQNLLILTYATPDGERYYRMERALAGLRARETTAAKRVERSNLGTVVDPETREWYETEASRMADEHAPDDAI